jgi:hypothetical protein
MGASPRAPGSIAAELGAGSRSGRAASAAYCGARFGPAASRLAPYGPGAEADAAVTAAALPAGRTPPRHASTARSRKMGRPGAIDSDAGSRFPECIAKGLIN